MEEKSVYVCAHGKQVTPKFFVLIMLVCLVAAGFVFVSQEQKRSDIKKETAELQKQYDELLSEKQRVEYMIEYAQSDSYRIQYAREKLGYVDENDIKFEITE